MAGARLGTQLSAVDGNAAASLLTFTLAIEKYDEIGFVVDHTNDSATAITAQIYLSVDGGTTYGLVQSESISSGTGTQADYTISNAVSGDETFFFRIKCSSASHIKAIFDLTSGAAADKLTVQCGAA